MQSLNFSGFEAVKRTLHPDPTTPAPLPVYWAAGCGGTLLVTVITCPSQRIKIQQQSATKGIGLLRCVREMIRSQGLAGLYKGYTIHLLLEGVGRGWYMLAYETMKRKLYPSFGEGGRDSSNIPLHKRMAAGACAGVVGWTSIYPLDVVRSRVMAQREAVYSGALDCAFKTFREGGVGIFFRGIKYTLVRAGELALECVLAGPCNYHLDHAWQHTSRRCVPNGNCQRERSAPGIAASCVVLLLPYTSFDTQRLDCAAPVAACVLPTYDLIHRFLWTFSADWLDNPPDALLSSHPS